MPGPDRKPRIALFISSLNCGGAERAVVNLLRGLDELQVPVDLLLARAEGAFLPEVPASVRVVELGVRKLQHGIFGIARYLRRERPHGLISQITTANVAVMLARLLARVQTKVALVEQCNLTATIAAGKLRPRVRLLAQWLYPWAHEILAASTGVARDVEECLGLESGRVRTVFNPIVDSDLLRRSNAPTAHRWLEHSDVQMPVLLAVGRLAPQKDYPTLLHAFARLRKRRPAKLLVYGEGPERGRLEALRRELGLDAEVDFAGRTDNPFAAMRRASLLVLSSRFEGFGNVLVEALACGCPTVSTNCPDGPAEILGQGKFGILAPPAEPQALAAAMLQGLDQAWDRPMLQARAAEFSVRQAVLQYLKALDYPLPQAALAAAA